MTITDDWLRIMLVVFLLVSLGLWLILRRDSSQLELDSTDHFVKSRGADDRDGRVPGDEFGLSPTANTQKEKQMSGSRAKGRIVMVNEWW